MSVEKYSYLRRPTCRRLVWISFSRFLTFFIPDFLLYYVGGLTTSASRQSWREKIALFFLFLFSAAFFCVWLEFISSYFCDPEKPYEYDEVFSNNSKMAAINGKAVDWKHTGVNSPMINFVNEYPHHDLSANFPKFMMLSRSSDTDQYQDSILNDCVYYQDNAEKADAWLDYILQNDSGYTYNKTKPDHLSQCPMPDHLNITGGPCFYGADYEAQINTLPIKGDIEYDPDFIKRSYNALPSPDNSTKQAYVILDGYVLDVTSYLIGATTIIPLSPTLSSRSFALDRMFLPLDLTLFLYINLGKDITDYFNGNVTENPALYRTCLVHLFQKGVVPSYISSDCTRINPALWATMGVGLLYFLVKMNLAYLSRVSFIHKFLFYSTPELSSASFFYRHRSSSQLVQWPHTILMVPCFSESSETLRQTLDTLSRSTYDDTKKLLLFVCDGVTTSTQEQKETHVLLLEYLGYSCTEEPLSQAYNSLGQHGKRINYARVYSGYYETGRNRVPYVVIVKIGQPQEEADYYQSHMATAPPGNRGKRDSLVLVFGFLERCMNLANNRITPLDYEIFNQCYNVLGIDPRCFKYMMVTDADIQVQSDVVQKLVSRLEQDCKMLAVSGHVRPANPEENLTTMLQIFPVYMAFFSGLAYEACLRSVMTINGGLVMYKIWTENVPMLQQEEQNQKFLKKWKLLQKHQNQSNNTSQQSLGNHHRQPQLYNKWPKLSDEIIVTNPFQDPPSRRSSTTNDSVTTITTATTTATTSHRAHTRSTSDGRPNRFSTAVRPESRLSLSARVDIRPCCVHPTVLRGISTPYADTMHMQNVLLLGEEKIMPIVLLKSHPQHRLGFEPEAVGYATLPTNFFSLQGLQTRNIRTAFHTQLEMQRVAWQLGITYWILSTTELLDMIFSMPIIVYLYGIFGRSVRQYGMAYVIIACSFTGLVALHILFFLLRRQFRYILWFVLYCLLSLPLFAIWFPILAVWQSNYAEYWYDVWPTTTGRGARLHGIIDNQKRTKSLYNCNRKNRPSEKITQSGFHDDHHQNHDNMDNDEIDHEAFSVPRMRLGEYEVAEARRLHQAAEAALDSNFTGFTGFAEEGEGGHVLHSPTNAFDSGAKATDIATPPLAQLRDGVHSTRITTNYGPSTGLDMYGSASTWRNRYPNSKFEENPDSPVQNPFADTNNPFDDDYAVYPTLSREHSDEVSPTKSHYNQHRPSHSQSSYFTYASQQNDATNGNMSYSTKLGVQYDMTDGSTLPSSLNSSGFAKIPSYSDHQQHSDEIMMNTMKSDNPILIDDDHTPDDNEQQDRASTLSISSKTFSIYTPEVSYQEQHETHLGSSDRLPRHRIALYNSDGQSLEDDQPSLITNKGLEEGRSRAVHNFTLQQSQQQQNASHVNLRQQYDNHATLRNNINNNNNNTVLLKSRRLKKAAAAATTTTTTAGGGPILHIPSSSSLSHHFRNMSDSTNPPFLKNQPSRSTLTTNEIDIQAAVKSEIKSFLQRVNLESTTRAQVKSHLIQHFGIHRIDESDGQLMNFINQCIENVTSELLNSSILK